MKISTVVAVALASVVLTACTGHANKEMMKPEMKKETMEDAAMKHDDKMKGAAMMKDDKMKHDAMMKEK